MSEEKESLEFWIDAINILACEDLLRKTLHISKDEDMIKEVKQRIDWTPSINNERFKKSSVKAMKYAEESIKAANKGERSRSIKLANMITAFAKDGGDLALGHLIRSQLFDLFGINFYHQIAELELCLKSSQPPKKMKDKIKLKNSNGQEVSPNLKKKELIRFLTELQKESKLPGVKRFYEEKGKVREKKIQFTRELFTLKSPNPKAPALEDFVEIKYDSVKGRHLVVTKDVPIGTTLMVERAFVSAIGNVFDLEINRCHHCFRGKIQPHPCPNCVFVLCCSEKCFEESKEYHKKYECTVLPNLHTVLSSVKNYHHYLCAYKTVCTFGPHELFRAFQNEQQQQPPRKESESTSKEQEEENPKDFVIPGFDPETGIFDSSSFYAISHSTRTKDCCSISEALISLSMTRILETRTDFFQKLESQLKSPEVKTQFQDFITRFLVNVRNSCSMHCRSELKYFDDPNGVSAVYLFSLLSVYKLTNHSCHSNFSSVDRCHFEGLGTVGIAMRDLKKGEELCRNYHESFSKVKKSDRQTLLEERYHFNCECVACLNDWPLMEILEAEKENPKFCCPLCSSKIPPQPEMMTKENYEKIALNSGNNFICSQCETEYKEDELLTQFKRNSMALNISEKLIQTGSGQETLKSLKTASSFFQNHLIPPSFYQIKCHDLVSKAIGCSVTDVYDD